jgi:RNA polymerase sigma factor for flagellar operon FliA
MTAQRDDADRFKRFVGSRDPQLREEITLSYLPLVHFVLGRLGLSQAMGAEYEDAASQGLIGLIEAVDRFDPQYGTQFSTYATLRVRGRVLDHLRSMDWLSRTARRRARTVQKAITHLWGVLQRAPTDEELAGYLEYDRPTLQRALVDSNHVIVSLDTMVASEGESEVTLHEVLADEEQSSPAEALDDREQIELLAAALRDLPERQQLLLSLYYYDELTLKEIGEVLGVTESRVCQLHARAVMDLRGLLEQAGPGAARDRWMRPSMRAEAASAASQANAGR